MVDIPNIIFINKNIYTTRTSVLKFSDPDSSNG